MVIHVILSEVDFWTVATTFYLLSNIKWCCMVAEFNFTEATPQMFFLSHANWEAQWMAMSVGRSVHYFGSDWNILTYYRVDRIFTHGHQRMNPNNFGNPLTFLLASPWVWHFWFLVKWLHNYRHGLSCNMWHTFAKGWILILGEPLTFHLVPPLGQNNLWIMTKYS